jgi:Na+/H+ antiporter NhaD/arsenite permease-like protein
LFIRAKTPGALLALIIFGCGIGSALLMNDTLAIIGTPLMVLLARQHRLPPQLLLLALAFAITTGSVMSPIGNPQNLLIAITMENPFIAFAQTLMVPTLLALGLTWLVLRAAYRPCFDKALHHHHEPELCDVALARLAHISLLLLMGAIVVRVVVALHWPEHEFPLSWIALFAASPLLLYRQRVRLLREIDWSTLTFFAALFIVMAGVWQQGILQQLVAGIGGAITSLPAILFAGLGLSQLISNVPLVSLYLPLLQEAQASSAMLLALAASSTLAGNLLVMGAASNVIVIQNGERLGVHLGFWEFARLGVVLTLLQMMLFYPFLGV